MRWLFPEILDGHLTQGAMLVNISANILNFENAATPLGLKAMQELQTLSPQKDTATNSMAMFMAINTSNVTLIPFTIIGYRQLQSSENPAEPVIWHHISHLNFHDRGGNRRSVAFQVALLRTAPGA